jgi:tRNA uridine 5-carbamoylmethylation protein Kti12
MMLVYDKMIEEANKVFLNSNQTVVLDSTFLDEARRTYFLDRIKGQDYTELVLLHASIETILMRNHKRIKSKWVPEEVIKEMMTRYKEPANEEKLRYNKIINIDFE